MPSSWERNEDRLRRAYRILKHEGFYALGYKATRKVYRRIRYGRPQPVVNIAPLPAPPAPVQSELQTPPPPQVIAPPPVVVDPYESYLQYEKEQKPSRETLQKRCEKLTYRPLISVVIPLYNTPSEFLHKAIKSVEKQIYENWELWLIDDASPKRHVLTIAEAAQNRDARVKVYSRPQNGNISAATNDGFARAQGEFVALLDHDDELTEDALSEIITYLNEHPDTDIIYTDQDKKDTTGKRHTPFFKPDWSLEYFRSVMYVGHLLVARKTLIEEVGGSDSEFDNVQDYELMLRMCEKTSKIAHIPKILYHWRAIPGSIAEDAAAKCDVDALQEKAVQNHLNRMNFPGLAIGGYQGHRVTIRPLPRETGPLVSIMIPTKDQPDYIGRCLKSIYQKTAYRNFEVILANHQTEDAFALEIMKRYPTKVLDVSGEFHFAGFNNQMAKVAQGEYLLLLNNDTEIIHSDWLDHLLLYAEQEDVGAVGPKLIYPDKTVQHAGVILGPRGTADHLMRNFPHDCDGYCGSLNTTKEVSAVTAACLLISKEKYLKVGGLNELYKRHYEDLDFCLKLRREGYRNLYVGTTELIHHESKTRGKKYNYTARVLILDQWEEMIEKGDPYYNCNFAPDSVDYTMRSKAG
ncbi:O-antigen biosynthesis glycosyltransferase rfbC [Planctomycetales bacterium 10988]|nr:O-antigen biosynthesis glycosyltransferase rfbC [Planctomycetales bacterium 10988]